MSDDQKRQLQTQLWNIANELRGKMNAGVFRLALINIFLQQYSSVVSA